jgi:hypothetical protein
MDKEIVKIETVTKQTFRSKSTNKTYDSKEAFLQHHKEDDLAVDTAVTVTNKGLDLLTESNEFTKCNLCKLLRGGTELQFEYLRKYVSKDLLDQVQITTSVPEKITLHPTKLNILWQKNSYDQPNLAPWFKDKSNHKKYDWYVFNSHWNYEKFRMMFDVPTEKCLVIKNGVDNIKPRNIRQKQSTKIKLIFHPTPWRGLNIILAAMQYVKNPNIELDVYSSTEVYGEDFKRS